MGDFFKTFFRGAQKGLTNTANVYRDVLTQEADEQDRDATVAERTGQKVGDFFAPAAKERNDGSGIADPQLRVRDVVRESPDNIANIGRPILRSLAALGSKIGNMDGRASYLPETPFEKSMFGSARDINFTSIGKETRLAEPDAKTLGIDPILGGAIAMLDAPTGGKAGPATRGVIKAGKTVVGEAVDAFKGATKYTTKVLEELKGKTTVSRQFIEDLLRKPDIKQGERDIVESVLRDTPDGKIKVIEFADQVEDRVLPLNIVDRTKTVEERLESLRKAGYEFEEDLDGGGYLLRNGEPTEYDELPEAIRKDFDELAGNSETFNEVFDSKYRSVVLGDEFRGDVTSYRENVYQSPIPTSGGYAHFPDTPNYFGHSRIENMADGVTRRVIEVQSDLFQKGGLAGEGGKTKVYVGDISKQSPDMIARFNAAEAGVAKLTPYKNTWWERLVREEVKSAGQAGITKLQFPTGKTAMRVEGLGGGETPWMTTSSYANRTAFETGRDLDVDDIKIGSVVTREDLADLGETDMWIIADDANAATGQFSAVPKQELEKIRSSSKETFEELTKKLKKMFPDQWRRVSEEFSIADNIDTGNPIFRFYERDMAKYLKNKYGAKEVTDSQGVTWIEVTINPQMGSQPVEAFAAGAIGLETDEDGNLIGYDVETGIMGAGFALLAARGGKEFRKNSAELKTAISNARAALATQEKIVKVSGRQNMVIYRSPKGDLRLMDEGDWDGTKTRTGAVLGDGNIKTAGEVVAIVRHQDGKVIDPLDLDLDQTILTPKAVDSQLDSALVLEAYVARTFKEFSEIAKKTDPEVTTAELRNIFSETDKWKSDPLIKALADYKLSVSGGSAKETGKVLTDAISSNPKTAAAIKKNSQNILRSDGVTTLYRYGDKEGMSWTTKPDEYFAQGRELQSIELTPEVMKRVAYTERAENGLGLESFPNTGEGEVLLIGGAPITPVKTTMADILKPKKNERRFITRTRSLEPGMDQFLEGKIEPRSTEELAAYADAFIESDIEKAITIARENTDDKAVAIASRLIDKYVNDASNATSEAASIKLWEAASEIANDAAKNLTENGRAIQAATLLGRTTPEGMVRFAARTIQKHNDNVRNAFDPTNKTLGDMLSPAKGKALKQVPELTGAQAEDIVKRMKEVETMDDGIEKAQKLKELTDEIQTYTPDSLYRKITTVWKAGLLTGLKTTGLNIASNTAFFASEVIKDIPASLIDRIASIFTGKRTMALTLKGMPGGLKEGAGKGWRYWRTGFDERDIGAKLDYRKVNFGTGKVAKAIQGYEEFIFKTIGAQDQPFYYASRARSMSSQAIAAAKNKGLRGKEAKAFTEDLLANPTDEMIKYSVLDAETAVFQNSTTLGKAARAIQNLPGGQFVLPFGKTPSAVATQIINYSPLGLAKTMITNIGRGKFDQRTFSQGMGRGIVGMAPYAIGMSLFKNDMLTLGFPSSEKERKQWELEGRLPNSIKLNGEWRNVAVLGPAGLLLIVGGHFQNGLQQTGSLMGGIIQSVAGFGNTLTEQSFLKGINQAIQAIQDPARSFNGYASSLAGSIVPTIIADIARSFDDFERKTSTPGERIQSRIPGARENLEPKVDTLGNQIQTQSFWTVLADPTRPGNASAEPEDKPIVDELRRLLDAGFSTTPTQLGPNGGYESLTAAENTFLLRLAGTAARDAINESMNSRTYGRLDDEQKSDMISDRISDVKVEARARVVIRATQGLEGAELQRKLAEMKADGLLTRQVYKKYQSLNRRR